MSSATTPARHLPAALLALLMSAAFGSCPFCHSAIHGSDAGIDGGDAGEEDGGGGTDAGVDAGLCFTNPQSYLEIINACTNAPSLGSIAAPPCLLADGGLPALGTELPAACLPLDAGTYVGVTCDGGS